MKISEAQKFSIATDDLKNREDIFKVSYDPETQIEIVKGLQLSLLNETGYPVLLCSDEKCLLACHRSADVNIFRENISKLGNYSYVVTDICIYDKDDFSEKEVEDYLSRINDIKLRLTSLNSQIQY